MVYTCAVCDKRHRYGSKPSLHCVDIAIFESAMADMNFAVYGYDAEANMLILNLDKMSKL